MIYVFPQIPKAMQPLPDLSKSFNSFGTGPEVAQKVQHINTLRVNFYSRVEAIERNAPNQLVGELDWMPLFEYLHSGADLLELGVKVANFPFDFKFTSVLSPSKEISINDGTINLISRQRGGR